MSTRELKLLCDLVMCSDPSPLSASDDAEIRAFLNREAVTLGFEDWIDAFHRAEVS